MQPLTTADIRPPSAYEPVRDEARRRVVELKRPRRVALGDVLTVMFENRDTVRSVVEELLRAERIDAPERIAEQLEVFNELIPGEGELCATLFIEVTDPADLVPRLDELRGIEAAVHLEVLGRRAEQDFDDGGSAADRTSNVHHLRFRLDPPQRAALPAGGEVALVADHEHYRARTLLTDDQRAALAADLQAP